MRNARPVFQRHTIPGLGPQLVPPVPWTERPEYKRALAELKRMCEIEGQREKQLVSEAEHAAELRFLRRKAKLIHAKEPPE